MLKELLNKDDEADNSNKDSKNNTITTNKKLNSKAKYIQLNTLESINKLRLKSSYNSSSSHKNLYTSISKEKNNDSFNTQYFRMSNNRKNSLKSFNSYSLKKNGNYKKKYYPHTDIRNNIDRLLYTLFEKKMLLLKDINNLRRYKDSLIKLNEENNEFKKQINSIENDIAKYRNIIQTSQKNYIDLSFEYSNLKSNYERIKHIINNYEKKKKK
jgi:hypothetical protein